MKKSVPQLELSGLKKEYPPIKRNARQQIVQLMTRRTGQEYDTQRGIVFALAEILKVLEQIRDNTRRR